MFFVFECGNAQEGEATGGLGDMCHKAETLDLAKSWAEANCNPLYGIEILDGTTGDVWSIGNDGEWSRMTYFYDALSQYVLENRDTDKIPAVWASLCNIQWVSDDDVVTYSFRTAGGEIADILGEGSYMDWYCSAPVNGVGGIPKEFADHMAAHGWTPREWPMPDIDTVINIFSANAADQIMAAIFKK